MPSKIIHKYQISRARATQFNQTLRHQGMAIWIDCLDLWNPKYNMARTLDELVSICDDLRSAGVHAQVHLQGTHRLENGQGTILDLVGAPGTILHATMVQYQYINLHAMTLETLSIGSNRASIHLRDVRITGRVIIDAISVVLEECCLYDLDILFRSEEASRLSVYYTTMLRCRVITGNDCRKSIGTSNSLTDTVIKNAQSI